jgi:hypothetical protein
MRRSPWYAIDTFDLQSEQIHCLNTLIDHHGYWRAISVEKVLEGYAKNWVDRRLWVVV